MFDIVLYEPEIPPNTGNIMRLAANTGARLHLIEPLGFLLSDRRLRRAGLDYDDKARVSVHRSLNECEHTLTRTRRQPSDSSADCPDVQPGRHRWFALSTRGSRLYSDAAYRPDDVFIFGPETRGLPADVLEGFPGENIMRLPMLASSRSLNLANAVSIVIYEAWRQCGFAGAQWDRHFHPSLPRHK